MDEPTNDRVGQRMKILDRTIQRISDEATHYDRDAKTERRLYKLFAAALAVLAVAAPALVTFQTQQQYKSQVMTIVVIAVTTLAGAGTALLGVFRWGDHFRRTRLTALELKELLNATELDRDDIADSVDDLRQFAEIRSLNDRAAARLQGIIRNHIESEVALVSPQTAPSDKAPLPSNMAAGPVSPSAPPSRVQALQENAAVR